MASLFGKKCAYCGKRLEGTSYISRMGKNFCSNEHADAYWEYKKNAGQQKPSSC